MTLFGINSERLENLVERALQALLAAVWFLTLSFLGVFCFTFCILVLFTPFWYIVIVYSFWIYADRKTCEKDGRVFKWFQNTPLWHYLSDYFPAKLVLVPAFQLDPKRNYLLCCYPHGLLPIGPGINISLGQNQFRRWYPDVKVKTTAMELNFFMPILRELVLAIGFISVSLKSLCYSLSKLEGGSLIILFPGGAEEVFYASPGRHKIVIQNRKGFVKAALKSGAPIVPVYTFGETDLFDQLTSPVIRKFQRIFKNWFGFVPVIPIGFIPRRKQLTTVVGEPINVSKVENPTDGEIEELHQRFIQELFNLFEKYKHKYLENGSEKILELV